MLPYIRLIEVRGQPPRFKARLVGTQIIAFRGCDYTGQWLDEAYPDFEGSATEADFFRAIETRQPQWKLGEPNLTREKFFYRVERVNLPLARDGKNVDMIVCVIVFHDWGEEEGDVALPASPRP